MRKNLIDEWHKYPFIGTVIPLMAGIVSAEYINIPVGNIVIYTFFALALIILAYLAHYTSYRLRFLFGLCFYVFLFVTGYFLSNKAQKTLEYTWLKQPCTYRAVLMTNPASKKQSVQCEAYLLSYMDGTVKKSVGRFVMLSFAKDSAARILQAGDAITYYARTTRPESSTNPGMFDYAGYLRHQGIAATAYLPSYAWWKVHSTDSGGTFEDELPLSVRFVLAFRKTRNYLLDSYRNNKVKEETVAVLSALTLGDVSGLPQQLKDDYSVSGAGHILALSGSHLAVLYAILELLFSFSLYRWKSGKFVGKILIITLIWSFVFLTGSQPSVVRAAVMYTLLTGASLFSRKSLSLNSLAAAAFFMLMLDPLSLFDVGFQLSFLAVLGILLFNDRLYTCLRTPYKVVNYIVSILTVSISVQIISAPLVLYYFSSFPLYFLLTNLLVVPISSVILLVALLGFFIHFVAGCEVLSSRIIGSLYWMVELQNRGVTWISGLPHSSLYLPGVTVWLVLWGYVMLLFFRLKKYGRPITRWYVGLTLMFMGTVCVAWQWQKRKNTSYIVFYDNRRCPAVHLVSGNRKGLLFPAWKDSVITGMSYIEKSSWKPSGIPYPEVVVPEDGILQCLQYRILLLKDFRWMEQRLKERLNIDYVWICRGFYGNLSQTLSSFSVGMVILDASLSEKYRALYRSECIRLSLPFHDIMEKGAYKVLLQRKQ